MKNLNQLRFFVTKSVPQNDRIIYVYVLERSVKNSFSKNLIIWYKKNARDLPWRRTTDPYKIWISEVMLQQTTVNAVIPYYERWIKIFPDVASAAKAPLQKILNVWQGLGYYQRVKNIQKAAKLLCEQHNGKIPSDREELRKLPGFGPYTVGAVLSIAFDQRQPIIDANVRRVIMRYLAIEGYAEVSRDGEILSFLEGVLPSSKMSIFNQALMELGALVCRNKEPLCLVCPIQKGCQARQKGLQEMIPTPKKRVTTGVEAAIALIEQKGFYFIQKRPAKGLFADLWEFPGGKVEQGETIPEALYREVKEELNVLVDAAGPLFQVEQFYTQFRAKLHVWNCQLQSAPAADRTRKWVSLKNLTRYPMPSGSVKIVDKLRALNNKKL